MANKPKTQLTQGLVGYGPTLKAFRAKAAQLTGDFTFSATLNDGYYRALHGLDQADIERLILAQSSSLVVLNIWAVFR